MFDHLRWVVGDAPKLWELHEGKPWTSLYIFIKLFESIMRGFGQVCFANNPWSGVLIFLGLIVTDIYVGLGALVAVITALCMSRILDQPDNAVVSGLQNYSAVLVGCVTISLFPIFFDGEVTISVWCGIIFMSALSVCIGIGLGVLLSPNQLPVYTFPFNFTISILFLSFQSAGMSLPMEVVVNSTSVEENVVWTKVLEGTLKASGQVFAVEDSLCSLLILFALLINSPFLTCMSVIGGALTTLMGVLISAAPYNAVYAGVWGYNGFLASGCIAFFVYPNFLSILLACLNAIFAAFLHSSLAPVFKVNHIPVFTFPFCLASLLFLPLIEKIPGVERVANLTFPEDHLRSKRNEEKRIRESIRMSNSRPSSINV